jgi:hypothetical protein
VCWHYTQRIHCLRDSNSTVPLGFSIKTIKLPASKFMLSLDFLCLCQTQSYNTRSLFKSSKIQCLLKLVTETNMKPAHFKRKHKSKPVSVKHMPQYLHGIIYSVIQGGVSYRRSGMFGTCTIFNTTSYLLTTTFLSIKVDLYYQLM